MCDFSTARFDIHGSFRYECSKECIEYEDTKFRLYIHPHGEYPLRGGYNDRFAIGTPKGMWFYGNRLGWRLENIRKINRCIQSNI